jgi:hypothetical protein
MLPANATLTNGTGQFSATLDTVGTNESITAADTRNSSLTATQAGIEVDPNASISGPYSGVIGQTLTYTLGPDPAGTVFTVNWGDGSSVQTTATAVAHIYSSSADYSISVTATAAGLTSKTVNAIDILPISVTIEADPALPGTEMLVVASMANSDSWRNLALAGDKSGVSLSYDGIALGTFQPTNKETFALVEVFDETNDEDVNAQSLSVSSVLIGGPGECNLYGGSGRNLLIAGTGRAGLAAGPAGDILIGGTTSYDSDTLSDQTALAYIMAEWGSADSYSTRIKKLQSGGGLNGSYVLNSTTVFENNVIDGLYGHLQVSGNSLDWFIVGGAPQGTKSTNSDLISGNVSGEKVTYI